ncbi:ABC transporter substrate-binding protein [Microbacterium allomyrinae]|uniref:Thiamine pyrimidine synthase n=1 Tax=Microbacterium allomyrinae TaxID=2830666 RepID=A0A9X1S2L8_9MICO|nr:ABC transporter substrate-binding protein [Microbacterium allomyrinae]MCC2031245.1 ABC transporter substrate-binding protein [Microbacterium allomyrinae]
MMISTTMRTTRAVTATLLTGALLAMAAGCAASAPASDSTSATDGAPAPAHITIATPTPAGTPAGVPIWIGEMNGYFAEENLTVEVVTFPGQPANAIATVIAGQADLVISAPDALIVPTANQGEQGLTWIFTPYQAPTFAIAVLDDSDIEDAADLEGKTVAMPSTGAPFETFLAANISGEGGDPSSVQIVAVAGAAAVEQLRSGGVDAIVMNPGDIAQAAVATGTELRMLPLSDNVAEDFGAGFLMRTDSTDEEKDVYARYLRAYLKSATFAQANPEAALAMNFELYPEAKPSDETGQAAALANLEATLELFVPADNGQWGYISPDRWDAHIAALGLSEKIPDSSILYDNSLLDAIGDFDQATVEQEAADFGE